MMIPEEDKHITKEKQFSKDKRLVFHKMFGGLHWRFLNGKGDWLSVICNDGSYGHKEGLFEIYPSWRDTDTKKWKDSVKGYCSFGEVQKWINKLEKRKKKGDV